jgi:hypothetical protein
MSAMAAAVLLAASPAIAQDAASRQRTERLLEQAPTAFVTPIAPGATTEELLFVETDLRFTAAFLNANNNDGTSTQLVQALAQPGLRMSYAGAHEFSAILDLDWRRYGAGDDDSQAARSGQLAEPIINELWYRVDLGAARQLGRRLRRDAVSPTSLDLGDRRSASTSGPNAFSLTFGKRDIVVGSGLVLDRSLIAAEADTGWALSSGGSASVRAFAARTPQESFIDFDGSRPDFDADTNRTFIGVEARMTSTRIRPYAYALWQFDDNDDDEQLLPVGGIPTRVEFGYDSAYVGVGFEASAGEHWVYGGEAVYQWGESTSNPFDYSTGLALDPTRDRISAWAATAGVSYLVHDARRSRITAQLIVGSGDRDRVSSSQTIGGNASGTTDRAFNAFGSMATGYVLAPDPGNMIIGRVGASSGYGRRRGAGDPILRAGVDGFVYFKLLEDGGASFDSRDGERFVGLGADVYAAWAVSSDTTIDLRYGVFLPGEAIPNDTDTVRHLVYVGVTYAF